MPSHPSKFHLDHRLRQLSLGSSPASSLFYARLWHALCPETGADYDHEALHTLALCMLQAGEDYSALHLVRDRAEMSGDGHSFIAPGKRQPACLACALIVARCCNKLGRYTEGQVVLDHALGVNKGPIPGKSSFCRDGVSRARMNSGLTIPSATDPQSSSESRVKSLALRFYLAQGKVKTMCHSRISERPRRRSLVLGGFHRSV